MYGKNGICRGGEASNYAKMPKVGIRYHRCWRRQVWQQSLLVSFMPLSFTSCGRVLCSALPLMTPLPAMEDSGRGTDDTFVRLAKDDFESSISQLFDIGLHHSLLLRPGKTWRKWWRLLPEEGAAEGEDELSQQIRLLFVTTCCEIGWCRLFLKKVCFHFLFGNQINNKFRFAIFIGHSNIQNWYFKH